MHRMHRKKDPFFSIINFLFSRVTLLSNSRKYCAKIFQVDAMPQPEDSPIEAADQDTSESLPFGAPPNFEGIAIFPVEGGADGRRRKICIYNGFIKTQVCF